MPARETRTPKRMTAPRRVSLRARSGCHQTIHPSPPCSLHSRISEDDPRPARILDRKLGLAVLPCDTPDRSGQVIPVQRLDVLDLERIEVQIFQTEDGDGVLSMSLRAWSDPVGSIG